VAVPPLDDAARRRASAAAMDARRLRAEWKGRLAAGEVSLADLLAAAAQDERLASMRIVDALGSLPGVGPKRVERILEHCRIASTRRLRGLGPRQRTALLEGGSDVLPSAARTGDAVPSDSAGRGHRVGGEDRG
jgi:hypothetical protein